MIRIKTGNDSADSILCRNPTKTPMVTTSLIKNGINELDIIANDYYNYITKKIKQLLKTIMYKYKTDKQDRWLCNFENQYP